MALNRRLFAVTFVGLLALASPASAQQPPTARVEAQVEGEEAEDEPRNELALVLAGTRERAEGETSFTVGGEYARRLSDRFGIVGEFEHVSGPDSWVFAAPVVFQPVGGFKLFAGPGLERKPIEGELEEGASEPTSDGHGS